MQPDKWLGHEAHRIAGLRTSAVHGSRDRLGNDYGLGHHVALILLAHAERRLGSLLLVRTSLSALDQMISGDESPRSLDPPRLDDAHLDAKVLGLHA